MSGTLELESPEFRGESPTVRLMGWGLAAISEQEAIDRVIGEVSQGRGGRVFSANVDTLRQWTRSAELRDLLTPEDLVLVDGMPLMWASRLQGTPLPERVAGSTLTITLAAAAARADASLFLIGGNPGTAEAAARTLSTLNPGLRVAGTFCPSFGFEEQEGGIDEIAQELERAAPDIVFVGLPFPMQVRLIAQLGSNVPNSWFLGCGVSFSFIAGEFSRAPRPIQRLGLEWAYRLWQEPRRLWRRYLLVGIPFVLELLASALASRSVAGARSS